MGKYKHIITKLNEDSEYQKFFMDALKKFNVSDIGSFKSEDEKKKFFNYVDANYKGKTEGALKEEYFPSQFDDSPDLRKAKLALAAWFKNIRRNVPGMFPQVFDELNDLIDDYADAYAESRIESRDEDRY
jgi:hypothetical protein